MPANWNEEVFGDLKSITEHMFDTKSWNISIKAVCASTAKVTTINIFKTKHARWNNKWGKFYSAVISGLFVYKDCSTPICYPMTVLYVLLCWLANFFRHGLWSDDNWAATIIGWHGFWHRGCQGDPGPKDESYCYNCCFTGSVCHKHIIKYIFCDMTYMI